MDAAMAVVPTGIDDVTAAWLSAVLRTDVEKVCAERIVVDTGFSSLLYPGHLRGNDVPLAALSVLTEQDMLIHGDIRADNVFFDGDRCKIVDFQMAARESVRSTVATGVRGYGFDDVWRHYRFAVAYMIVLPVVELVVWDVLPERSRRLCVTLTDRASATIDEIGAVEVFDD